jgi:hypothetical protein
MTGIRDENLNIKALPIEYWVVGDKNGLSIGECIKAALELEGVYWLKLGPYDLMYLGRWYYMRCS